jgi:hypothetical protein
VSERRPKPLKALDPVCEDRLVALERHLGEQALRLSHLAALVNEGRRHEGFCALHQEHLGPCQDDAQAVDGELTPATAALRVHEGYCALHPEHRGDCLDDEGAAPRAFPVGGSLRPGAGALGPALVPSVGWEEGFQRLMAGRCPYCGNRLLNVGADRRGGLTWSCVGACNP